MSLNEPDNDPYWRPNWWKNTPNMNPSICNTPTSAQTWWSSSNQKIILGDLVIYFHYQFVIGFYAPTTGLIIAENWMSSSSLGRALNSINKDKKIRIEHQQLLNALTNYLREDFHF